MVDGGHYDEIQAVHSDNFVADRGCTAQLHVSSALHYLEGAMELSQTESAMLDVVTRHVATCSSCCSFVSKAASRLEHTGSVAFA